MKRHKSGAILGSLEEGFGIRTRDGSTRFALGDTRRGVYTRDGAFRATDVSDESGLTGVYARDGSLNISIVSGEDPVGAYAPNGSWNVYLEDLPPSPELVTNGTFADGLTGWDVNGSVTWVDPGVAIVADVEGADGRIAQAITAEIGVTYVMSFDVLAMVGGTDASARVRFGAGPGQALDGEVTNMGGLGHKKFEFVAAREEQWFTIMVTTTDASRTFDNVSIKKKA